MNKHYNTYLTELREKSGLSIKEAAKKIGISRLSLYLFENGYFRPTKKALKKLNDFYKVNVSLEGLNAYPVPTKEKAISSEKKSLKVRRIVFGALSAAMLTSVMVGVSLFTRSVDNTGSFYGETYTELKKKVNETGEIGHDLVTSLPFHYIHATNEVIDANVIFYETDNILYFNECTYSNSYLEIDLGIVRSHYQFGSNLGVSSYTCEFNLSSWSSGTYVSCLFDYHGEKEITEIRDFQIHVRGSVDISQEDVIRNINMGLVGMDETFDYMMSETLDRQVEFYDFLIDREQGRVINFNLQIVGLSLIIPGSIVFFIFFGIFIKSLIANIKPRLVSTEPESDKHKKDTLPKDWSIEFGIPDIVVVALAKAAQVISILLMLVGFVAKLAIPSLAFLGEQGFLTVMRNTMLIGIFLEHFVMIGRIKKATTLFEAIVYNLGIFLFIATMETILISITNAWGYDFAHLIYKYVPSNVYQVVAVHYLIFLFLFFQPPFLNKKGFKTRFLWHSLSFIPLGFLIATYFVSNAYALTYGVKENIYINFWFPNGFLALSIVSVLFLYITFAIRLYFERRYGKHNAQMFFYGDRYTFYENVICSAIIVIVALLDLLFMKNQYGYYLGLGSNTWILLLIPFIILCKYSPNNQQVFLVNEPLNTAEE